MISKANGGKWIDPDDYNPVEDDEKPEPTPEEIRKATRAAMMAYRHGLKYVFGRRKKKPVTQTEKPKG